MLTVLLLIYLEIAEIVETAATLLRMAKALDRLLSFLPLGHQRQSPDIIGKTYSSYKAK